MVAITVTRHIEAAPDEVFRRASDFAGSPAVISAIDQVEMLTDGPVGVGTRFRETRTMFNRPCTEEMEVTEFEPGKRYVLGADNMGCHYRTEVKVEPSGSGSDISLTFQATPRTFFGRVMSVLTRPLQKSLVNHCARDFDDLKASFEGGSGDTSSATASGA